MPLHREGTPETESVPDRIRLPKFAPEQSFETACKRQVGGTGLHERAEPLKQ